MPPTPPSALITLDGHGHLNLAGSPHKFTGVNAPELATYWGMNNGCGSQVDDLDGFFSLLRPSDLTRVWFYQDFGTNKYGNHAIDFTGIDRVVQAAERHSQRLIIVLGNNWGACDGVQKNEAWYSSGYRTVIPRDAYNTFSLNLTYRDWVAAMINRYKSSPAVGMWEPVNEAEGWWDSSINNCAVSGAPTLRAFYDDIGGLIHQLDPNHLVESGVIGGNQCGLVGEGYVTVHASPGIDVASFHDYGDSAPVPAGLSYRLQQATRLGKPLLVGEVGWLSDCASMTAKVKAQLPAGADGFLPWAWSPGMSACGL